MDVTHRERLAENLRRHLQATGMKQIDLARACKMAHPRICEILAARYASTIDTVERIEKALQLPSGSLLMAPPTELPEFGAVVPESGLTSVR
jgi:transcriptional regulator with XRE-family HTH domain